MNESKKPFKVISLDVLLLLLLLLLCANEHLWKQNNRDSRERNGIEPGMDPKERVTIAVLERLQKPSQALRFMLPARLLPGCFHFLLRKSLSSAPPASEKDQRRRYKAPRVESSQSKLNRVFALQGDRKTVGGKLYKQWPKVHNWQRATILLLPQFLPHTEPLFDVLIHNSPVITNPDKPNPLL